MILALLGCAYTVDEDGVPRDDHLRPHLEVGATELVFGDVGQGATASAAVAVRNGGEVPMLVALGAEDPSASFCVRWAAGPSACPDGEGAAAPELAEGACVTDDSTDTMVVLDAGCTLDAEATFEPWAVGEVVAGLKLATLLDAPRDDLDVPDGDPREPVQFVKLVGEGSVSEESAQLEWTPPLAVADWHWPDGTARTATATLAAVGVVDATFRSFDTSGCPGVTVVSGPAAGQVLGLGTSVSVELSFVATSPDLYDCALRAEPAAGEGASLRVWVTPPLYSDPPTLTVTAPLPGATVDPTAGLEVRATVADDLAPPDEVAVVAEVLGGAVPPQAALVDAAGAVTVTLPADAFVDGPAVVELRATDREGNVTRASLPVRRGAAAADDADGDGWGLVDGDCADDDAGRYPGATELVDGLDQDCDGVVDEDTVVSDDDGDGTSEVEGDCDDADSSRHSPALDPVNGIDDDCDGLVDERHRDADDDGDGFSEDQGDCDDTDPALSPFAADVCDGVDQNCDGAEPSSCLPDNADAVVYLDVSPDVCVPGEQVRVRPVGIDAWMRGWAADIPGVYFRTQEDGGSFMCPLVEERTPFHVSGRLHDGDVPVEAVVVADPDAGNVTPDWRSGPPIVVTACNPTGSTAAAGLCFLTGAAALRRRATGSARSPGPRPHTRSRRP